MEIKALDIQSLQLDATIDVNPNNGSILGSVIVPLPKGRNEMQPHLSLSYSSSSGNSIFGAGWDLNGMSFISIDTTKGLARYNDTDKYALNGSGSLVPRLYLKDGAWIRQVDQNDHYQIYYYREKEEGDFSRVEKWVRKDNDEIHWRIRDKNNNLSIYGLSEDGDTRVVDPQNKDRIFKWLLEKQFDSLGNVILYEYQSEDLANVDQLPSYEHNRAKSFRADGLSQRYLKRILYANSVPFSPDDLIPSNNQWHYELILDYGESEYRPYTPNQTSEKPWSARLDPFSTYHAGFEIRTYRLCKRLLIYNRLDTKPSSQASLTGIFECLYNERALGTLLERIKYTGVRKDLHTGDYSESHLPELSFNYTETKIDKTVKHVDHESVENIPYGVNSHNTQLIDLFGDGVPGILTESANTWYYKPNIGGGKFGQQDTVISKPSQELGIYSLGDFDQDGNLNLYSLQGRLAGHYEYDRDTESWSGFKPMQNIPQVDHAKFVDLNADGFPDLVIELDNKLICYPFKGKESFDKPYEYVKPKNNGSAYAAMIGDDSTLGYLMADMTGDGLADQVYIRNGRVEYYPNLGNGKFGKSVLMEDSPIMDFENIFDADRIKLYDLTGSGTSDIIYIGNGEIRLWYNASGNKFIDGGAIKGFPFIENISSVRILDLLGNNSPCLVWTNLTGYPQNNSIQFIELKSGTTSNLLVSMENGMGKEIQIKYGYSGDHYLQAKRSGKPWISKIPSHFVVAEERIIIDHITDMKQTSVFRYRDGHYDGNERRFVTFGLTEQYDSELLSDPTKQLVDFYTQPSCTKTWYHSGVFGWKSKRDKQYYSGDSLRQVLAEYSFDLEEDMEAFEFEQSLRGLAGNVVRQEVYSSTPEGILNEHPYEVSQNSYAIRRVQPHTEMDTSSFVVYQTEALTHNYLEEASDPRVTHMLVVSTDSYGNVETEVNIAYSRRSTIEERLPAQAKDYIQLIKQDLTSIDQIDNYQTGIIYQRREYDINHLEHAPNGLVKLKDLKAQLDILIQGAVESYWARSYYWDKDLQSPLPLGEVSSPVLSHHEEFACFTPELISAVFGDRVTEDILDEGNYTFNDGYWWQVSEKQHYLDVQGFFNVHRRERNVGDSTTYTYDDSLLHVIEVTDANGNTSKAKVDYNVGAVYHLTDPNGTITEVLYDALGVPVLTFNQGTILDQTMTSQKYGSELIADYKTVTSPSFSDILSDPFHYIQSAESFFYYDLNTWKDNSQPLQSIRLIRENLVHDGEGNLNNEGKAQIMLDYQDGFGRIIQKKQKVESGIALGRKDDGTIALDEKGEFVSAYTEERWLVSGHVIYNNKQQPIKQYEPFYSTQSAFEKDDLLKSYGVSILNHYDPLGQLIKTDYPDSTFAEIKITPWQLSHFDQNDTVDRSLYKTFKEILPQDNPERKALDKSLAHKNTPTEAMLDPLSREILTLKRNNNGKDNQIKTRHDSRGNIVEVIDSRDLKAFEYKYDMLGRILYEKSIDSGEKWNFQNNFNLITHSWDSRNTQRTIQYDLLDRPVSVLVNSPSITEQITERFLYGDDPSVANAKERNLKDQLVVHYDQAGKNELKQATPSGSPLHHERSLVSEYKQGPDWTNPESISFNDDVYSTKYKYDALNRILKKELPDRTLHEYNLNSLGAVQSIKVSSADGTIKELPILKETSYDAKGLRQNVLLGNDVGIEYNYDEETYRLKRLSTRAKNGTTRSYQDIHYTYDPVGNLVHCVDESQQPEISSGVLRDLPVSSHTEFEYDALYQLTSATGRIHQALLQHDHSNRNGDEPDRIKGTRHISLNNAQAIERYERTYAYDQSGNLLATKHKGTSRSWTSKFRIASNSNRSSPFADENGVEIPDTGDNFDANGNCLTLSHLRKIDWDYRNNISRTVIIDRTANGKPNDEEYYVYDGEGKRIRKITQRLIDTETGKVERIEKIYFEDCEIKRITLGETETLRRTTCHVHNGVNTIALIYSWQQDLHKRETEDITANKIHYQLTNHLGSSSLELDEAGNIITYEEYFPYGGTSFIAGRNKKEINLKEYRYSGKEMDGFSGLYYYGYRYYAHWIGGWLSPDPIGPTDAFNLYLFVRNNPINLIDPNGLQSIDILGQVSPDMTKAEAIATFNKNTAFKQGYRVQDMERATDEDGEEYWLITQARELTPQEIATLNRIEESFKESDPEVAESLMAITGIVHDLLNSEGFHDPGIDSQAEVKRDSDVLEQNEVSTNIRTSAALENSDKSKNDQESGVESDDSHKNQDAAEESKRKPDSLYNNLAGVTFGAGLGQFIEFNQILSRTHYELAEIRMEKNITNYYHSINALKKIEREVRISSAEAVNRFLRDEINRDLSKDLPSDASENITSETKEEYKKKQRARIESRRSLNARVNRLRRESIEESTKLSKVQKELYRLNNKPKVPQAIGGKLDVTGILLNVGSLVVEDPNHSQLLADLADSVGVAGAIVSPLSDAAYGGALLIGDIAWAVAGDRTLEDVNKSNLSGGKGSVIQGYGMIGMLFNAQDRQQLSNMSSSGKLGSVAAAGDFWGEKLAETKIGLSFGKWLVGVE